jgi:hypothetical protein
LIYVYRQISSSLDGCTTGNQGEVAVSALTDEYPCVDAQDGGVLGDKPVTFVHQATIPTKHYPWQPDGRVKSC